MQFVHRMPNGMNLSRSVSNPKSRYNRILSYLRTNGPRTRVEILRDVFDREVGDESLSPSVRRQMGYVSRGWGWFIFRLMILNNVIRIVRVGNRVTYEVV